MFRPKAVFLCGRHDRIISTWHRFTIIIYNSRKKVLLFYKRANIKVKLNQNKSAVMQSYRYKCSQIRCRETEVLPLPLSCRIYQITNSNHQSINFSLVINHSRYIVVYIYIIMIYNIIEYTVYITIT